MRYTKAALPSPQLIARWQAKGLVIADIAAAERALTFVGYFRIRGYALPLMQPSPTGRIFVAGATFDNILARYELDRDLRRIVLGQLERIEVAVRTVISNQMALQYGPFWYFNHPQQVLGHAGPAGRVEAFRIGGFLSEVERETHRSRDPFAQHYFTTYTEPLLPPSWLMAECVSFGKWSQLYKHLQKAEPAHPNPKKAVAKVFGLSVSYMSLFLSFHVPVPILFRTSYFHQYSILLYVVLLLPYRFVVTQKNHLEQSKQSGTERPDFAIWGCIENT